MERLSSCCVSYNGCATKLWTLMIVSNLIVCGLCEKSEEISSNKFQADGNGAATGASGSDKLNETPASTTPDQGVPTQQAESNNVVLYRRLFRQKRVSQMEAMQTILDLGSYEKQKKMITAILMKLFVVLEQSRVRLTEVGYVPGDPFPTQENIRDALSSVLENTAFLGDIVLRLPDITHSIMKQNPQWKLSAQWGVAFSNDTHVFVESDAQLLNLMAQELGFVEKDPNYVNPYRADTIKAQQEAERKVQMDVMELMKKAEKERRRKEKKKNKGPRMSAPRHSEL